MSLKNREKLKEAIARSSEKRDRTVMKRCFMTGKQCIFPHATDLPNTARCQGTTKPSSTDAGLDVFVIMPFTPNIDTFYRWSLQPFLLEDYSLHRHEVQRADDVRDIGYIVCEKICRRIQDADLVIAEMSVNNANVFYEVGLAYGLGRPIILLQDENQHPKALDDACVRNSLALPKNPHDPSRVISYRGLARPHVDARLEERYQFFPAPSPELINSGRKLKLSFMTIAGKPPSETGDAACHDISLDLEAIVSAAIQRAMVTIRNTAMRSTSSVACEALAQDCADPASKNYRFGYGDVPWAQIVTKMKEETWQSFSTPELISVDELAGFEDIARQIESSFCTIIDITDNKSVACFWLGYCHARGLNAVPIARVAMKDSDLQGERSRQPSLAFDIRALWYAQYNETDPSNFEIKMQEILEHLLERDLPDRQKRQFWDRVPSNQKLKVFTGAIHHDELNREMVGDWDVRTVSELFSYLPSIREAKNVELVTPIYSPEKACQKAWAIERRGRGRRSPTQEFSKNFIKHFQADIEKQLKGAHAIVIASPETNAVTEYLLHRIYQVLKDGATGENAFELELLDEPEFTGYVVIKKKMGRRKPGASQVGEIYKRLFYVEETGGEAYMRGFEGHLKTAREREPFVEPYLSQDECKEAFNVLGHLVVAKYPPPPANGNYVILLNGVSGPATFALAEILTGAVTYPDDKKNAQSEQMLDRINRLLDDGDCIGVEAIIKVEIEPGRRGRGGKKKFSPTDLRQVKGWQFRNDTQERVLLRKIEIPHR